MEVQNITSPCNGKCGVNPITKLCKGCFRTMEEIFQWVQMSDAEKTTILEKANSRRLKFMGK